MTKPAQIVIALAAVAAVAAMMFWVDPSQAWFLPTCTFHKLTGLYCPGCGMTRATHHLLHGHLLAALRCNALFTLALPCVAAYGIWRWTKPPQSPPIWKPIYLWLLLGGIAVFTVVRNIPVYPFTLLVP